MDERTDGWMDRWIMGGWRDGQMNGCVEDGWMNEQIKDDERMMNGQMDDE